jgi:lipoprotein signal peptidase
MVDSLRKVLGTTTIVVAVDQISKYWAAVYQLVTINPGVSFSWLGEMSSSVILGLSIFAWVSITYYLVISEKYNPVVRGLVIGGGMSNVIDRLWFSGVRDWLPIPGLNLHNNLADYALVLGFFGLVLFDRLQQKKSHES